ncbi:TonB family protein [Dysgonomonas hofstadii]|uniref:TonB family protein n=1 Tax=Dysgonomonas hofstadii TaxID=637886 RepID=A0A840CLH9_9BACT|nr:TonB family protein [Dysgonomonas hofstadii]MBB4035529.1 TonB family protein [Dysgonomonas hofstadii]
MKSLLLLFLLNTSFNTDSLIVDLGIKPDSVTLQNQITLEELKAHKEEVREKPFIPINTEIQPQFPGGDSIMQRYVRRNIKYPKLFIKDKKQGDVVIRFAVMKKGNIPDKHIKIMKGTDEDINKEVIRIIKKMPKWAPGKTGGMVVPFYMTLTFSFFISEDGSKEVEVYRSKPF